VTGCVSVVTMECKRAWKSAATVHIVVRNDDEDTLHCFVRQHANLFFNQWTLSDDVTPPTSLAVTSTLSYQWNLNDAKQEIVFFVFVLLLLLLILPLPAPPTSTTTTTPWKKNTRLLLPITAPNIDRFSKILLLSDSGVNV